MNVLIVDDHALFRSGLKLLLSGLSDDARFDEVASVEEALAAGVAPDLVLLDLNLRGVSGLDAMARMREALPDASIVVLSGEEDPGLIRAAIEAGASGFIPKASTAEVMIGALRLVLAGGIYLPPLVLGPMRSIAAADREDVERRHPRTTADEA